MKITFVRACVCMYEIAAPCTVCSLVFCSINSRCLHTYRQNHRSLYKTILTRVTWDLFDSSTGRVRLQNQTSHLHLQLILKLVVSFGEIRNVNTSFPTLFPTRTWCIAHEFAKLSGWQTFCLLFNCILSSSSYTSSLFSAVLLRLSVVYILLFFPGLDRFSPAQYSVGLNLLLLLIPGH